MHSSPPSSCPPQPQPKKEPVHNPQTGAAVQWLADGSPYSPRFGDRYHSHAGGGLAQAQGCFLQGCGLPEAWQGQRQWRILETGFGLGLNFLATWQAWRDDPQRCQQLHFISTEAWPVSAQDLLCAARNRYPQLLPLAEELALQYRDLHSGIHRLSFEQQRVHLTLAIGPAHEYLRSEGWQADSVYLDGFSPTKNPDIWSPAALRAVARCCIPGHTLLATWCVASSVRQALAQCGFGVERVPGIPPKKHNLRARYAPPWPTRARSAPAAAVQHLPWPAPLPVAWHSATKPQAIVIGAGLAGASMAHALAERGWQVEVLEQADAAAQGASGLPVGLFAPHISPDDAPLSRLSRAGLRSTRRLAARLLRHGLDWQDSGVLEHRIGKRLGLPAHGAPTAPSAPEQPPADQPAAPQMASQASRPAQPSQRLAAGLDRAEPNTAQPPQQGQHPAVWHAEAGWLRPAALVQRLLQHPQITLRTRCRVQGIAPVTPSNTEQPSSAPAPQRWQVLVQADAAGSDQALEADCLVIAAAFDSQALAQPWADARLPLNPVRGQIAWGIAAPDPAGPAWPAMPVNGKGSFVHIPLPSDFSPPGQRAIQHGHAIGAAQPLRLWVSGATFEREAPLAAPSAEAVAAAWQQNRQRLSLLMPAAGPALAQHLFQHSAQGPQHWGAVRCTTPDRTPCYGPIGPQAANVLLATGLGARGLTLATLCAEIVCALLHDEPLPVARQLAALVLSSRLPVAATTATPR